MKTKELFDGTIASQYSYFYVMNYCEEVDNLYIKKNFNKDYLHLLTKDEFLQLYHHVVAFDLSFINK